MKRIAVLASGQGTNLEAILKAVDSGEIAGRVEMVISDRQAARALEIARRRRIKALFLNPVDYRDRNTYDAAVVEQLNSAAIDLVVLAGFMRLLSADFVRQFPLRIMNIHPSLLPAFPGGNGVEQALAYGVKVTGCTVHFVDEGLDSGPVILQEAVPVFADDTVETLHQRIHAVEYRLYPRAIELFCRDKLIVEGRRCFIVE
jgi:phosphoribosylglycinamide formyltransferase-1